MRTIHLISHTHWDREWYFTFQEFRFKLIHLVDVLLDILAKNQNYKYFLLDGQAIILDDYLEICPSRANEIINHIKQGRINFGPWYISPDEFLISGEGHIRNLLEGDKISKISGGKMKIGYLPDTFGHIGQMPQILNGFGIREACVWRGLDDQPCELTWEAPDGSSVLLSFLRESYSNAANLSLADPDKFITEIQELSNTLFENSLTNHILLMNGTDHMEPTSAITDALDQYQAAHFQDTLLHSNLPQYFDSIYEEIEKSGIKLPKVIGELRSSKRSPLLPNVLSTRIILKQRNQKCKTELLKWVEPITALLYLLEPSPLSSSIKKRSITVDPLASHRSIIRYAWKLLMKCHPHDSICGTSIDQVFDEMMIRFDQVDQINAKLIDQGLKQLSEQIDTTFADTKNISETTNDIITAIIVFNPNDVAQTGIIDLLANIDKRYTSYNILDDKGYDLPYEHSGMGRQELISMTLDKKAMKQALRMVHEGNVAGLVIRNFDIKRKESQVEIIITLSDHGLIDIKQWNNGVANLEALFMDTSIDEFIIHAYSDPETKISFVARDVPSHGYRCYWIQGLRGDLSKSAEPQKLSSLTRNLLPLINLLSRLPFLSKISIVKKEKPAKVQRFIENEYFIVEVQLPQGVISITDKRTDNKYDGQNLFVDSGDCGDVYNFCPPENDSVIRARVKSWAVTESAIHKRIEIIYEMAVPASITPDRKSRSNESVINTIVSTITLIPGVPRIDFHTEVDNKARDHRLRVHFPAHFHCSHAYHDGHFEIVERQIGLPMYDDTWAEPPRQEVPQGDFTMIHSGELSFTIANRGLPEVEVFWNQTGNSEIALTLLRSVGWLSRDDLTTRKGHAGPMGITTPNAQMIGKYSFDYSIIPGDKNLSSSIHQAYAFAAPLKSTTTSIHPEKLPSSSSFIQSKNQDFIITTIKFSEIGDNLIVRGYNRLSSPIKGKLKLWRAFKHAYLTSLEEKIIQELMITQEGEIIFDLDGKKIITLQFCDRNLK